MKRAACRSLVLTLLVAGPVVGQEMDAPRPIAGIESVWLEELTWMEVRDRIAQGTTTAIISTGGVEQNGPYVALGKHNYVLESVCPMIAERLGNALCAPIIKLVPEGDIDEPSGHMRYPGTLSVRQETFEMMLTDVARSLAAHGFTDIVFIGDSGGNQRGMANVAEALNGRWQGTEVRAHFIPEFYDGDGTIAFMRDELGIEETENDGFHDFYWITVQQMVTDPATVRYDERVEAGLAHINGLSIAPKEEAVEVGKRILEWRADTTARAIRTALAGG
ncbi:MAG: creatininase family protein [Gemmatimonadota bacterium]